MEWIDIKDKLPEDDSKVLVYESKFGKGEYSAISFGYYYGGKWHWENSQSGVVEYYPNADYWDITHWMPLPDKPSVGKI